MKTEKAIAIMFGEGYGCGLPRVGEEYEWVSPDHPDYHKTERTEKDQAGNEWGLLYNGMTSPRTPNLTSCVLRIEQKGIGGRFTEISEANAVQTIIEMNGMNIQPQMEIKGRPELPYVVLTLDKEDYSKYYG